MLSIFWLSIGLLALWVLLYLLILDENLSENEFITSGLGVIVCGFCIPFMTWNWFLEKWYDFIYSSLPTDNSSVMTFTTCLLFLISLVFAYLTPPLVCARIHFVRKPKKINYYELGKSDGFNNKKLSFDNKLYIAGFRDGINMIKEKNSDSYK